MRPNTFCLTTSRQSTLWTTQFPVTPGAQVELGWWTSALNLSVGMVFPLPLPTCTVTTDASHRGWGGTPRGGTGPRPVVSTGVRGPRQPARSIGGPRDAPSLRTTVDGASSAHTDRQLDGGCLPEQSGGYSLKSALQTYGNAASVVL